MKKKIATLTLCAAMTASLCSCYLFEKAYYSEIYMTTDNYVCTYGDDVYYITNDKNGGTLYKNSQAFFEGEYFNAVFVNNSGVYLGMDNKVVWVDNQGQLAQEYQLSGTNWCEDIFGDDEYVFVQTYYFDYSVINVAENKFYDLLDSTLTNSNRSKMNANTFGNEITEYKYDNGLVGAYSFQLGDFTVFYEDYGNCDIISNSSKTPSVAVYADAGNYYCLKRGCGLEQYRYFVDDYSIIDTDFNGIVADIEGDYIAFNGHEDSLEPKIGYKNEDYVLKYNPETEDFDIVCEFEKHEQIIKIVGEKAVYIDGNEKKLYAKNIADDTVTEIGALDEDIDEKQIFFSSSESKVYVFVNYTDKETEWEYPQMVQSFDIVG